MLDEVERVLAHAAVANAEPALTIEHASRPPSLRGDGGGTISLRGGGSIAESITVGGGSGRRLLYAPNDPLFGPSQAVAFGAVGIPSAWDLTGGSPGVVVQVVDSGLDLAHEDLITSVWTSPGEGGSGGGGSCANGLDDDGNGFVDDCHGYNHAEDTGTVLLGAGTHGMHIAGLIAAAGDNGVGIAGVAGGKGGGNGAAVMVSTTFGASRTRGFAEAIVYGADNGADISSNSWVYSVPNVFEQAVMDAIDYAADAGVLIVFAAGNNHRTSSYFPAASPRVISVFATTDAGKLSSYSNYGGTVDIGAPGDDLMSTVPYTGEAALRYAVATGTSFATPLVSGALALAKSYAPGASNDLLLACLAETATPLDVAAYNPDGDGTAYGGKLGSGWLNAGLLVACARHPTPPPTASFSPTIPPGPSPVPVPAPSAVPAPAPSPRPTAMPSIPPSPAPFPAPSPRPTAMPSVPPTSGPSLPPSPGPTAIPTAFPTTSPAPAPSPAPFPAPSPRPSPGPSTAPTALETAGVALRFTLTNVPGSGRLPTEAEALALRAVVAAAVAPRPLRSFSVGLAPTPGGARRFLSGATPAAAEAGLLMGGEQRGGRGGGRVLGVPPRQKHRARVAARQRVRARGLRPGQASVSNLVGGGGGDHGPGSERRGEGDAPGGDLDARRKRRRRGSGAAAPAVRSLSSLDWTVEAQVLSSSTDAALANVEASASLTSGGAFTDALAAALPGASLVEGSVESRVVSHSGAPVLTFAPTPGPTSLPTFAENPCRLRVENNRLVVDECNFVAEHHSMTTFAEPAR